MLVKINSGTLIENRYLIRKFLGQGGFGRTYLALDTQRFNEPCVLKEFIATNSNPEVVQKYYVFFEREARILYQIEHPQIPKFKAWFATKKRLFIVQEFINGKTYSKILSERLSRKKHPFDELEIRTWLSELLSVLDYIHEQHIIHRDISLENIMFDKQQGKPVLIDFGVVKEKFTQFFAVNSSQQQPRGSVVGKIGYSPPEQLRMGHCYPCSDIYALGVCAIVLLTGKPPFMLIDQSLEWDWESHIKVSDSLTRILKKILAEKPVERYQSAKEVLEELHGSTTNIKNIYPQKTKKLNTNQVNHKHQLNKKQELNEEIILQQLEKNIRGKDKVVNILAKQEKVQINQNFIDYCQQELISFVGPFASVLIKRALECAPAITPDELMEVLTESIPHPQQAKEFKSRVQNSLRNNSNGLQHSAKSYGYNVKQSTIFNSKFIEDCRRELTSFVGPIAKIIIDDILRINPEFTIEEFIEILITEIPDRQRAENFKKRIQAFY